MIQKILELLERFVAAQEKMAEANMLLVTQDVDIPARKPFNPETSPAVQAVKDAFPGAEVVEVVERTTETAADVAATGGWNPFTSEVQGRYAGEKQAILNALLAERGLPVQGTGAEKHQALLDYGPFKDGAPTAEDVTENVAEDVTENVAEDVLENVAVADEIDAANAEVTVDDVRQLAQKAMTAKMAAPDIQVIFEKHGGSKRLPEIPAEKLAGVFAALTKAMKKEGA